MQPTVHPVLPEKPVQIAATTQNSNALIPGARMEYNQIIGNIQKHTRKASQPGTKELASYDQSVQGNNMSMGLNSGRDNAIVGVDQQHQSQSRYSQLASNGTLPANTGSQAVLGLQGKD